MLVAMQECTKAMFIKSLLDKTTDRLERMKLSDEIKDLGIQITEAEKVVEDKENGQKEETVSVSKDILRDYAMTPEQIKDLENSKNQAAPKEVVEEKKKAIEELSKSKETDADKVVKRIIEAGIVPESIEGYDPLSPFAKATEDMFNYKS